MTNTMLQQSSSVLDTIDDDVSEHNKRLFERFDAALETLNQAKPFAKSNHQTNVFQLAALLIQSDAGINYLYSKAPLFDGYGVFYGGPWQKADKLLPELVRGGLDSKGDYFVVEVLSELRLLAIAKGFATNDTLTREEANQFLNKVIALNFDFLFPTHTEASRHEVSSNQEHCERLFALLIHELSIENLRDDVIAEIEQICVQRPIMTNQVRKMIELADRIPNNPTTPDELDTLEHYIQAVKGASPLSNMGEFNFAEYREHLNEADTETLTQECHWFAKRLHETGLSSPNHAVLLRYLASHAPDLIGNCLGLSDIGMAELNENNVQIHQLIKFSVLPTTYRCIYGFSNLLERSLLSRTEISQGLQWLVELDIHPQVRKDLLSQRDGQDGATANAILVAGTIMVLGQPLGIGQGKTPTCQAARGISLWAQHAPGYLIKLIISAARDGCIEVNFEGDLIRSDQIPDGLSNETDLDLDPVSIILVPHLDRVYNAMMKRILTRNEDGHKWVNPALYGQWVPTGFSSAFDIYGNVVQYQDFIRLFYASHHPSYNNGAGLMYPNPVGLLVTNAHGALLGPHAVSLQRIAMDTEEKLRVYFYNPNNEGRQNWGQDICPSIQSHGEQEGESSLPFEQFASRLYAFHYNQFEIGDAFAIPQHVVDSVQTLASESWGKSYVWK